MPYQKLYTAFYNDLVADKLSHRKVDITSMRLSSIVTRFTREMEAFENRHTSWDADEWYLRKMELINSIRNTTIININRRC